MLTIMVLGLVMAAVAIIAGAVLWGFHNDTLRESDQERFDRRFDRIAAIEMYSRRLLPRPSAQPPVTPPPPLPLP